jgi:DNA-binding IclR family transcriptional regulator
VRDSNGRFIAALAFHGPAQRVSIKAAENKRDVLIAAAQRLTDALFS